MVDELGGIEAAIAYAADQAELSKGQYEVRTIPQPKTLADLINGSGDDSSEEDAMMPLAAKVTVNISADSILRMMPAPARRLLGQHIQMMQLMEKHPVVLMSPFVVTVK